MGMEERAGYLCFSCCIKTGITSENISDRYFVHKMEESDVAEIYDLCRKNKLYYQYCQPFVSESSIRIDMNTLPPNKEMKDKYYLGYYDGKNLIAIMDLRKRELFTMWIIIQSLLPKEYYSSICKKPISHGNTNFNNIPFITSIL